MSAPAGLREDAFAGGTPGSLQWTLDQPARRNAIGPDALAWIAERCTALRGETVVIRGAGPTTFCAGFDLTALQPRAEGPPPDAPLAEATAAMEAADATFVAAINGVTIGAGVELCCACDLRITVRNAWFAIPAAKLGVVYHAAGLARLHRVLGPTALRRLLLLGDRLTSAQLGHAMTRVVLPEALDSTVAATVAAIARGAPPSQRAHRDALRALESGGLNTAQAAAHDDARAQAYARIRAARER